MNGNGEILEEFLSLVGEFKQYVIHYSGDYVGTSEILHDADVHMCQRFIEKNDIPQNKDNATRLKAVRDEIGDCTRCPLHTNRKNIVFGTGFQALKTQAAVDVTSQTARKFHPGATVTFVAASHAIFGFVIRTYAGICYPQFNRRHHRIQPDETAHWTHIPAENTVFVNGA